MIKYSIITVSYNHGKFIESNILSVLKQNYKYFEHIVIDGGSNDNTLSILKNYDHLIWLSEKDNGQSDALNKGFKMATGDIICWINSDDELSDGALKAGCEYFLKNSSKLAVAGGLEIIDEQGRQINILAPKKFTYESLLNYDKILYQPSIFFKRHLFDKVGYINEKLHFAMDYDFFLRVTKLTDIEPIPKILSRYRQYSSTKTQSCSLEMAKEQMLVREKYKGKKISKVSFKLILDILRARIKKARN